MKKITSVISIFLALVLFATCKQATTTENCSHPDHNPKIDTNPFASVTELKAVPGDKEVVLSWKNPTEKGFKNTKIVYTDSVEITVLLENTVTEKTISDLLNRTEYTFNVYAIYEDDKSSDVQTVSAKPMPTDLIPTAPVTDVAITGGNRKVTLSWTNPEDEDFANVRIYYSIDGESCHIDVPKPETTVVISGLKNGFNYDFNLVALDAVDNEAEPANTSVFLPLQQGDIHSLGVMFDSVFYRKTAEVIIVPKDKFALIDCVDDSAWDTYYNGTDIYRKGVFLKGRKIKLSPYVISAFEVTQELYLAIMENNPSNFDGSVGKKVAVGESQLLRPVESVTWYEAVAFCNGLTKKTMTESDCVYYNTNGLCYTKEDAIASRAVTYDKSKKGYRLPTETEWEFAARGGDMSEPDWKYSYAGVQTKKSPSDFINRPYWDEEIDPYAWYHYNAGGNKTHEVGRKLPNRLGLFDMSGNVWEWCYDFYHNDVKQNDAEYLEGDVVVDPSGAKSSASHTERGGFWDNDGIQNFYVSFRNGSPAPNNFLGIRLARSL